MKRNVLIFSGGSYPAIEIYFCLQHSLLFNPIAASSYDDHSQFLYKKSFNNLPYIQDKNFIATLNQLIINENIEFIIPTHDSIALFLMENSDEIKATIVCSPVQTAILCRYKSKMYEYLKDLPFIPIVYKYVQDIAQYPVICKPNIGEGSRNVYKLNSTEEFNYIKYLDDYIICEYLPGEEVTIDCFTNYAGELLFTNARKRTRITNGISSRCDRIVLTAELKSIVDTLNQKVKFRGYWFAQVKRADDGTFKLLEICTRFSGTFCLSKNLDVNLPLLALCDFAGMDVSITPNDYFISSDKTYIDRFKINIVYQRVYIDFDETLVFNRNQYNTFAMMFLYQCLNKGIDIILISKHEYDLYQTMNKIKLNPELFKQIIIVPADSYKYKYMDTSIPSIFIDNSYIERKQVKEHLEMYTFDVSNIEALVDWS